MYEPLDERSSTDIQIRIEDAVTNGLGYEPIRLKYAQKDDAFELQRHLFIMECKTDQDPQGCYLYGNPVLEESDGIENILAENPEFILPQGGLLLSIGGQGASTYFSKTSIYNLKLKDE